MHHDDYAARHGLNSREYRLVKTYRRKMFALFLISSIVCACVAVGGRGIFSLNAIVAYIALIFIFLFALFVAYGLFSLLMSSHDDILENKWYFSILAAIVVVGFFITAFGWSPTSIATQ